MRDGTRPERAEEAEHDDQALHSGNFAAMSQNGQGSGSVYDDLMQAAKPLETLLRNAFPEASELTVEDRTGGGDHFQVTVAADRFQGLSLVEQHRLVYDALAEPLADGTIHELRIKTRTHQPQGGTTT